jgi:hypothetical protein
MANYTLLPTTTITGAVTNIVTTADVLDLAFQRGVLLNANFVYGSGGTTADAWVQTSADGGVTWYDVANFHFTTASAKKLCNLSARTAVTTLATPGDAALTANTSLDGLLGDRLRVKYTTVGTYAGGTTLQITAVAR